MEGGSRDQLQSRAGAVDHVGVSEDDWAVLTKTEKHLGEMSDLYLDYIIRLRDATDELMGYRREILRLRADHFNLCILHHTLQVEQGILPPAVDPMPVRNPEEGLREEEEKLMRAVNQLHMDLHHEKTEAEKRLDVHRLALQSLNVPVRGYNADQSSHAVRQILGEAEMLLRQIGARFYDCFLRLRHAIAESAEHRFERHRLRAENLYISLISHELQPGQGAAAPEVATALQPMPLRTPTKMEEPEVRSGRETQVKQGMYKTELCNKWKQGGACIYGDRCRFAHGQQELRPITRRHPRYKTLLCQKYATASGCPYGDRCQFRHSPPPFAP